MLLLLFLSSVLGLFSTAFAVSSPICSNAPYKELLALSTYAPALSFCSAHFPLKACTSTHVVSSTIQSTVFSTSTSTTTITTGTTTVSQVSTATTTSTITVTDPAVLSTVSIVTVTTTITLASRKKRNHDLPFAAREPRTTAKTTSNTSSPLKTSTTGNPIASIWSKLASEAESIISVACTCIETQPPCATVTSTTVVKLPPTTVPTVTTVTTKIQATTTISTVITDTITATTHTAPVSDVTATTTVTVSLPFYTLLGSYVGCEFLRDSNTEATTFTDPSEGNLAITFCQNYCTTDTACTFVYVQYVNSGAQNAQSFWACYYTDDDGSYHFNSATDLNCNEPPADYGQAYAYQNARTT